MAVHARMVRSIQVGFMDLRDLVRTRILQGLAVNTRIELVLGDIATQDVDAIVNAANETLLGGGGVDGAIHRAAGPGLREACEAIPRLYLALDREDRCHPGRAVTTAGYALPSRWVIHAVGPRYPQLTPGFSKDLGFYQDVEDAATVLDAVYRAAIREAVIHGVRSIAFPSISTGAFGYPVDEAAPIAAHAVREAVAGTGIELVRFVLFDEATVRAYERAVSAVVCGKRTACGSVCVLFPPHAGGCECIGDEAGRPGSCPA